VFPAQDQYRLDAAAAEAAEIAPLTPPQRFLVRMIFFLVLVVAVLIALYTPLQRIFMANAVLNGLVIGVLCIGILYVFRQVLLLRPEVEWIEAYRRLGPSAALPKPPVFLKPMAAMLRERQGRLTLSTASMRSILDSISARLAESREISRYLVGLLIFLGLLGTFWGLVNTIAAVAQTISGLTVGSGDIGQIFDQLKAGLQSPLAGMSTAFSTSLFGLGGSLVLGFLDLQAGQAQNRFYEELEEWLSGVTRLSSGALTADGEQTIPAYVSALLEQTADSLDNLQRIMARNEEMRAVSNQASHQLAERLTFFADQMRSEQDLMVRLADGQRELRPILDRLAGAIEQRGGLDEASRSHLRSLDVNMMRLVEESAEGRNRLIDELRAEIKVLARTLASREPIR
jgi:hypothetical protein